ncbi:hypothetical protein SL003B_1647 [Polymorphum gilvum SL003B-26A1]|uniref:Uncharacterized protein n=1 Tax=Polymorphum gilvum (strain LMG 25793 / CGMCC 1.9160 / SL003B-26A1) TaxID=991905 RepID=F2J533_POLGS|nr:hypothetical protein SL003B_1647 [Polymorphum gilvum SL003B-26A1]
MFRLSASCLSGLVLLIALVVAPAAQTIPETPPVPETKPDPNAPASLETPIENLLDGEPVSRFSDTLVPYAPSATSLTGQPGEMDKGALYLVARLSDGGPTLSDGVIWRIYSETPNSNGNLELVATSMGGDAEFRLDPGAYLIHTAYGHAGATNRLVVGRGVYSKTVVLNAGGVRLDAALGDNRHLGAEVARFDIFGMDYNEQGERQLITTNVGPETIVRLNAGTYHVVSRYGDVNAVVRADIRVEPGKLTGATVYHQAADITLKLVNEPGGEAIANTSWSVLTPGGDIVVEASGAFPDFVLAAGEYEVIARNNGVNYSRSFTVVSGEDREVEVLTSSVVAN